VTLVRDALVRAILAAAALAVLLAASPAPAGASWVPPPPPAAEEARAPLAFDGANATELVPNQSVGGTLPAGGQRVYKVFANRSDASTEALSVSLGTFGGLFYYGWVEVFDPYQVLIDHRITRFDGQVNVSRFIVGETGYYLLVVSSTNTYDWSLTVNWTSGVYAPADNDNDLGNATLLAGPGGTAVSNVSDWDDLYDTYRFDMATRGGSADAIVLNLSSAAASDIDLYVYHIEGGVAVIDSYSISPTNTEYAGHYAGADGPVYVRVLSYSGSATYNLTWLLFDAAADANNRPEVASTLPAGTTANNLSRWDARDIFRIAAPSNTTLNVSFHTLGWNASTREPDLQAVLWDASFGRVTWSFLFDPAERVDALLVGAGVYYLEVYARDMGYFLNTRMHFDYVINASVDPPPAFQAGSWTGAMVEDTPATFDLRAVAPSDPPGEAVSYTVVGVTGPVEASIGGGGGGGATLSVTPAPDAWGNASVSVRAADRWRSVDITLPLSIAPVNDAPRLRQGWEAVAFDEDTAGSLDPNVTVVDPEGDDFVLVAVAADLPLDATVVDGVVIITPPPDYHGVLAMVISVRDALGAQANLTVGVEVRPVNDAPRFVAPFGPLSIEEDAPASSATFGLAGLASDPDGDPVTYLARGAAGVSVLVVNATLTLVPARDFHGEVEISLDATDGALTVTRAVLVRVAAVNDAPVLVPPPGQPMAREGQPFQLNITASDVDTPASDLRYSFWLDGVAVANLSAEAAFTHAFGFDDEGFHVLRALVSDGALTAAGDITVFVAPTNRPPVSEVLTPAGSSFRSGEVVTLSGRGTDPDGDTLTFRWIVDGSLSSQSQTATLHGLAAGPHTAVLFVTDGDQTAAAEVSFTVVAASPGADAALAAALAAAALSAAAAFAWRRVRRRS